MTFHGAGGEVDQMARGFETLDATLDTLRSSMRDLSLDGTGPDSATPTFTEALAGLERGLGRVATKAREAAVVVRRFEAQEDSA